MARKRRVKQAQPEVTHPSPSVWLKAVYHVHIFHYRMPETAAIAALTPFVPSPLTVKMAMVAALLQRGDAAKARELAPKLPQIEIRIMPPQAAFSFKAFLRYRSVPAVESTGGLDESGSFYPSRPHTREYAFFADDFTVFVGLPDSANPVLVQDALRYIRYLGCKDSQVWCIQVQPVDYDLVAKAPCTSALAEEKAGSVAILADFAPEATPSLEELIPGKRVKTHYRHPPPVFVLPGRIIVKGKTRLFVRNGEGHLSR